MACVLPDPAEPARAGLAALLAPAGRRTLDLSPHLQVKASVAAAVGAESVDTFEIIEFKSQVVGCLSSLGRTSWCHHETLTVARPSPGCRHQLRAEGQG